PADPSYPALNLAQAVAICLYEVRRAWLRRSEDRPLSLPDPPAPFADQERAFEDLRIALEEIHYLYGERGAALMHGLRHLLGRARSRRGRRSRAGRCGRRKSLATRPSGHAADSPPAARTSVPP